jgi:subfamily B ATP-binding cassette protein MsbA
MVIAIGVGGVMYFVLHESIRPVEEADLVGFITAMVFLLRPIRQLTNVNVSIQRGIAAGSSIFQLLDESAERDTGHYEVTRVTGKVEFRNVNFAYTDRTGPVLNDIDLAVPPGQTLAIVGRSGSGKSTLVSLLPRFYEPESGQILIDDRPLNDYRLVSLRNQISLVSQEVVLFNDSIASNIAYGGLSTATREQIEAAAHAAHVDEFAGQLPDGLDTQVGDRATHPTGFAGIDVESHDVRHCAPSFHGRERRPHYCHVGWPNSRKWQSSGVNRLPGSLRKLASYAVQG